MATNQENNEEQEIESEETSGEINTLLPGNRYKIVVFSISADGKVNPEGSDALIRQTCKMVLVIAILIVVIVFDVFLIKFNSCASSEASDKLFFLFFAF